MKLGTYVVSQGDTIEIIAAVLLGDSSKAQSLIRLNKLRYPYISDNASDQYAHSKGSILLSVSSSYTDPSSLTISNANSINIMQNDTIFLQEGSYHGAAVVTNISGSIITLDKPIAGIYNQGTIVIVFVNQQNVTTQVLKTGDTLLYPISGSVGNQTDYSLLFKTDFAQDDNGFLIRSDNDIGTITGLANLKQSQKRRLQTPLGELKLHPAYGNGMYNVLGEAGTSYFLGLARFYAKKCVMQDPRIQSVTIRKFAPDNDAVIVEMTSVPIGSQDEIKQTIPVKLK